MKTTDNKEKQSIKLEYKNYKELGYESSLWKDSRFKPFCEWNIVKRWLSRLVLSSAKKLGPS